MNIGEAARLSGLQPKTVRYYEDIGLVTAARQANGYRDYDDSHVHKLRFVQRARSLGFAIDDCRSLLSLYEDRNRASAKVKELAEERLADIDRKIAELKSMRAALARLTAACHGDDRPACPILADLAGNNRGRG
ncbi:MAG TPA: Cu(I)-responsive transcriptional regulator [Kiloniellaceae bacterium]|nr:Cu(I)-responsive transcriptional regulator [Kiloniellaceae bacterium]